MRGIKTTELPPSTHQSELRPGVVALVIPPPQRRPTESGRVWLYLNVAQNPTHIKFLCLPFVLRARNGFARLLHQICHN